MDCGECFTSNCVDDLPNGVTGPGSRYYPASTKGERAVIAPVPVGLGTENQPFVEKWPLPSVPETPWYRLALGTSALDFNDKGIYRRA